MHTTRGRLSEILRLLVPLRKDSASDANSSKSASRGSSFMRTDAHGEASASASASSTRHRMRENSDSPWDTPGRASTGPRRRFRSMKTFSRRRRGRALPSNPNSSDGLASGDGELFPCNVDVLDREGLVLSDGDAKRVDPFVQAFGDSSQLFRPAAAVAGAATAVNAPETSAGAADGGDGGGSGGGDVAAKASTFLGDDASARRNEAGTANHMDVVLQAAEEGELSVADVLTVMYGLEEALPYKLSSRLLSYLSEPRHAKEMVRLMLIESGTEASSAPEAPDGRSLLVEAPPAPVTDERRRRLYSYVVSTMLVGGTAQLRLAVLEADECMEDLLHNAFKPEHIHPQVIWHVTRVVLALAHEDPDKMLDAMRRHRFIPSLCRHLAHSCASDLLVQLMRDNEFGETNITDLRQHLDLYMDEQLYDRLSDAFTRMAHAEYQELGAKMVELPAKGGSVHGGLGSWEGDGGDDERPGEAVAASPSDVAFTTERSNAPVASPEPLCQRMSQMENVASAFIGIITQVTPLVNSLSPDDPLQKLNIFRNASALERMLDAGIACGERHSGSPALASAARIAAVMLSLQNSARIRAIAASSELSRRGGGDGLAASDAADSDPGSEDFYDADGLSDLAETHAADGMPNGFSRLFLPSLALRKSIDGYGNVDEVDNNDNDNNDDDGNFVRETARLQSASNPSLGGAAPISPKSAAQSISMQLASRLVDERAENSAAFALAERAEAKMELMAVEDVVVRRVPALLRLVTSYIQTTRDINSQSVQSSASDGGAQPPRLGMALLLVVELLTSCFKHCREDLQAMLFELEAHERLFELVFACPANSIVHFMVELVVEVTLMNDDPTGRVIWLRDFRLIDRLLAMWEMEGYAWTRRTDGNNMAALSAIVQMMYCVDEARKRYDPDGRAYAVLVGLETYSRFRNFCNVVLGNILDIERKSLGDFDQPASSASGLSAGQSSPSMSGAVAGAGPAMPGALDLSSPLGPSNGREATPLSKEDDANAALAAMQLDRVTRSAGLGGSARAGSARLGGTPRSMGGQSMSRIRAMPEEDVWHQDDDADDGSLARDGGGMFDRLAMSSRADDHDDDDEGTFFRT